MPRTAGPPGDHHSSLPRRRATPTDRPPPSASSHPVNFGATVRRTRTLEESLAITRRGGAGMAAVLSCGGVGDGADAAGTSTLPPLVTVAAVTFLRRRKVTRNVLR